jgi:hypothetical protein
VFNSCPQRWLVSPGDQSRAGGVAERGGHVPGGEANSIGNEGVDVRRRDVSAVVRNVAVTKVVGEEDQDVGSVGLSLNLVGRREKSEDQRGEGDRGPLRNILPDRSRGAN